MMKQHNIASATYAAPKPANGYPPNATVIVIRHDGSIEQRRADDDVDGGGMQAFLAEGGVIGDYIKPKPTMQDIQVERARRLAQGFSYDFGDNRGVHQIGTSDADMVGWNEVDKAANALIGLGDRTTQLTLVTNTGPVNITAPEWMKITLAATAFRQPIWAGSFWLQAQDPIPTDYETNDVYWTAQKDSPKR